jgi:hypothetical protein
VSDEVAIYSRRCPHWQTRFNGEPFVALSCTWHLSNWYRPPIACWTVQGPGVAAPTRSRIFAIRFYTSSVTDALFTGRARFVGAWLIDWPYIDGAKFGEGIDFRKANSVVLSASFVGAWPRPLSWATSGRTVGRPDPLTRATRKIRLSAI